MKKSAVQALASAFLFLLSPNAPAAQLHKCVSNGAVTYQNTPCPSSEVRRQPTVEELNAERKKKLDRSRDQSLESSRPTIEASAQAKYSKPAQRPEPTGGDLEYGGKKSTPPTNASFKCDSRKYCSQMISCAEAKYFLANCPGVKLDGNHDGVPCEQQWCN